MIQHHSKKIIKKNSEIKQRLLYYIESQHLNKGIFFKKIDVTSSSFTGKALNCELGGSSIVNVIQNYPELSVDWLLLGKGEMLKSDNVKVDDVNFCLPEADTIFVRIVDNETVFEFVVGKELCRIDLRSCKQVYSLPRSSCGNVDFMIKIQGLSMFPGYNNGDFALCSIVPSLSVIQWGRCYMIVVKGMGILAKRLLPSEKGDDFIMLSSDNENFKPFDVARSEVMFLALVIGRLCFE